MSDTSVPILTFDKAVTLMDEVVAEYGVEHVYRPEDLDADGTRSGGCAYVDPAGGGRGREGVEGWVESCLIGCVLVRTGVHPNALVDLSRITVGLDSLIRRGEMYVPGEGLAQVRALLCVAQEAQDKGLPWGEARDQGKAAADAAG